MAVAMVEALPQDASTPGPTEPSLYLLPPAGTPRTRRAAYRRRRVGAVIVLVSLVLACRWAFGGLVSSPLAAAEPVRPQAQPEAAEVHIVQPGETWWSLARSIQPSGDVRPLVAQLSRANGKQPLMIGQRIELPARR